nr:immunoglobulin heavy chain junction region [Mus musculus]
CARSRDGYYSYW